MDQIVILYYEGFHPGNTGSNPVRMTTPLDGSFSPGFVGSNPSSPTTLIRVYQGQL